MKIFDFSLSTNSIFMYVILIQFFNYSFKLGKDLGLILTMAIIKGDSNVCIHSLSNIGYVLYGK